MLLPFSGTARHSVTSCHASFGALQHYQQPALKGMEKKRDRLTSGGCFLQGSLGLGL